MKLSAHTIDWDSMRWAVEHVHAIRQRGYVDELVGVVILARGPGGAVGDLVYLHPAGGRPPIPAEIVGFRSGRVILMAFGDVAGVRPGCEVVSSGGPMLARCGDGLLGRILDGLGKPADGKGPIQIGRAHV